MPIHPNNTHQSLGSTPLHWILEFPITQRSTEMTPHATQQSEIATTPEQVTETRHEGHERNSTLHLGMFGE